MILGGIGVIFLVVGILWTWVAPVLVIGVIGLIYGGFFLLSTASYLYTTRVGKFEVWAQLLDELKLQGDEHILDLGCGRGAVLLMAAGLLSTGKAVGVDLWQKRDQSGNAMTVTARNAQSEGVAGRVELLTADMRVLPFADKSFDVVLSSLAIHNIADADGREHAIDEAVRMLKPGGRLIIVDIGNTRRYAQRLQQLDLEEVQHRRLDWRLWFGGPWGVARLVSARQVAEL